jgi:hypothetical protein
MVACTGQHLRKQGRMAWELRKLHMIQMRLDDTPKIACTQLSLLELHILELR